MAQIDILIPHAPAGMDIFHQGSPSDFEQTTSGVSFIPSATSLSFLNPSPIGGGDAAMCLSADELSGAASLPTPPLELENFPGEFHLAAEPVVKIPGLPSLASGPASELVRSRILQAAFDAEMNEPDAEKAFFVADLGLVYKQFVRWKRCLPGIEPFYAIKCNPDPYVLRLLAALGAGFDCASHGEIQQVLNTSSSISPDRIIFANPCKSTSFIRHAAKAGVDMMTFDNTDELYKIAKTHPNAKLVVRILTDDSKSLCRLGLKFGAPLVTVAPLLRTARELGLDVIGVSFHVGSGCYDSNAFADAIARARSAFDAGDEAGYRFHFLDVGGGFESPEFEKTAGVLARAIETYFPPAYRTERSLRVIAEPGRYFVSDAFTIATNIIARRVTPKELLAAEDDTDALAMEGVEVAEKEQQPKVMYYINDGVYGAFNCIMFDHQHPVPYPLTVARSPVPAPVSPTDVPVPSANLQLASVWGPTCDSIDCVAPLALLPTQLDVGDWVGFNSMGAYTRCAASQFNGFEVSQVWYTSGADRVHAEGVRKALSMFSIME